MPYTLAHPGFALPLKKLKPDIFSTTGLIFGSITPDFDIILRFSNQRFHIFQYDMKNIFLVILPIAFISSIYFHLIIRNVLIDYAPAPLRQLLLKYKDFNYLHYLKKNGSKVIFSIVLAIFLHLFLDFISHLDAYPFKIMGESFFKSAAAGHIFYYMAMYIPPVLFSIAGFYLLYKTMNKAFFLLPSIKSVLSEKKTRNFILFFTLVTITMGLIKLSITGIEEHFIIDSLAISFTNGLMISFFVTPSIFAILNKLKTLHG